MDIYDPPKRLHIFGGAKQQKGKTLLTRLKWDIY